jgi:predicted nucleic acid-binding protein
VLLVDASVWVALADPGETFHDRAEALVSSSRSLTALDLTLFEVANAVGVKMGNQARAKRIGLIMFSRCKDHLVRVDPELMAEAVEIAAEHSITAYDAAYVAAARRNGWQLVSADVRDLVSKGLAVAPDAADYPQTDERSRAGAERCAHGDESA